MATSSPSSTASAPLTKIEEALQLEAIDENLFRCSVNHLWKPLRARGVFGGQIIGLALSAATKTVPETFLVHSLHSYFLLPGNNAIPILFHVSRVRDGKSFATRHVLAKQKGKVIFECSCSFQVFETSILNHQRAMPVVPAPEELLSNEAVLHKWIDNPSTHPRAREYFEMRLQEPLAIEFRPCRQSKQREFYQPLKREPQQMVWMRAKGKLPDNLRFHQCVVAYTSDHYLLNTSLMAHGISGFTNPQVAMIASLDHAIWFHSPFRADDWLLYEMESTRTGSGRGLCFGRVYTRDGTLVMSCAQEGVVRAQPNPRPLVPQLDLDEEDGKKPAVAKKDAKL